MTNSFDVAIIGAGPTGSSAAISLAENNYRVIVIEKKQFPRDKVCGGGLLARAKALLPEELNFPDEKDIYQVELTLPHINKNFSVIRPTPIIHMTMRSQLDHAMLDLAQQKGVEVIFSSQVKNISYNKSQVRILTDTDTFKAKFIIAADGINSIVCKSLGLGNNIQLTPAVECEIEVNEKTFDRLSHSARFDYAAAPAGYGWIFPKKNHLSVGLLSNRLNNSSLNSLTQQYIEKVIGKQNIKSIEKHGFVIPIKPYSRLNSHPRALISGDAAGLVDPLTAEGLSHAILSGQLAAKALIEESLNSDKVQNNYMKSLDQRILSELKYARFLSSFFYQKTWLHSSLMSRFGQDFCEAMTSVITGEKTYKELLLNPKRYWNLFTGSQRCQIEK